MLVVLPAVEFLELQQIKKNFSNSSHVIIQNHVQKKVSILFMLFSFCLQNIHSKTCFLFSGLYVSSLFCKRQFIIWEMRKCSIVSALVRCILCFLFLPCSSIISASSYLFFFPCNTCSVYPQLLIPFAYQIKCLLSHYQGTSSRGK